MKSLNGRAKACLPYYLVMLSFAAVLPAQAQDGSGFISTLKEMASDPVVRSMISSKLARQTAPTYGIPAVPSGSAKSLLINTVANAVKQKILPGSAPSLIPPSYDSSIYASLLPGQRSNAAASNPYAGNLRAPGSGFYSLDEGARLGGIGYSPSLSQIDPNSIPTSARPDSYDYAPSNTVSTNGMTISAKLAPAELKRLSRYDISVLVDRSGSMNTRDCPDPFSYGGTISRWQWCQSQSSFLSKQTAGALPAGIALVPFADKADRYANVSPAAINTIFKTAAPKGSTNLASALKSEFDRYFLERDTGMQKRPLMLAVITDGVPDSKSAVGRVIQEATLKMNNPDEIKLCFFLIGEDQKGQDFIDELSDDFAGNEMSERMISSHSFNEVNRLGLARSLAAGIQNGNAARQSAYGQF